MCFLILRQLFSFDIPCESKKTLHLENHFLFKIYALNMGMSDIIL